MREKFIEKIRELVPAGIKDEGYRWKSLYFTQRVYEPELDRFGLWDEVHRYDKRTRDNKSQPWTNHIHLGEVDLTRVNDAVFIELYTLIVRRWAAQM